MLAIAGCWEIASSTPPSSRADPDRDAVDTASNAHLVNAFDYVGHVGDNQGYDFTTPSGKWRCAILTRFKAGCQASSSWQSGLGIPGEPESVPDAVGKPPHRTRSSSTGTATRSSSRWNSRSSGWCPARPMRCGSTGSWPRPDFAATCRSPGVLSKRDER